MQSLHKIAVFLCLGHYIESAARWVDYWRSGNADFRCNVIVGLREVAIGNGSDTGCRIDEAALPEWIHRCAIGVKCIDAVVLGSHIDHIMGSLSGNKNARHIERLSVNLPIYRKR